MESVIFFGKEGFMRLWVVKDNSRGLIVDIFGIGFGAIKYVFESGIGCGILFVSRVIGSIV